MMRAFFVAFLSLLLPTGWAAPPVAAQDQECVDTAEGRICRITQPIIAGELVDNDRQRELGLVTVGGCSGTLIDDYWVLTAQHCVGSNSSVVCSPLSGPASIRVTAAWSTRSPVATRLIDFCATSPNLDVALIELGGVNFGRAPTQLLVFNQVDDGMRLQKFGRGISAYAFVDASGNPIAAVGDGLYRSAFFDVSGSDGRNITLVANASGQVGAGGDSGGPDHVVGPNGVLTGIAGVQSTCIASGYVAGQPRTWTWATGISQCNSAAVFTVRDTILQIIRDARDFSCATETPACGAPEMVGSHLLLLN